MTVGPFAAERLFQHGAAAGRNMDELLAAQPKHQRGRNHQHAGHSEGHGRAEILRMLAVQIGPAEVIQAATGVSSVEKNEPKLIEK